MNLTPREKDKLLVAMAAMVARRRLVVWDNCEQVVLTKAPFSRSPPYVGPERYLRHCENLPLPLSENDTEVTMILQLISFERGPA